MTSTLLGTNGVGRVVGTTGDPVWTALWSDLHCVSNAPFPLLLTALATRSLGQPRSVYDPSLVIYEGVLHKV